MAPAAICRACHCVDCEATQLQGCSLFVDCAGLACLRGSVLRLFCSGSPFEAVPQSVHRVAPVLTACGCPTLFSDLPHDGAGIWEVGPYTSEGHGLYTFWVLCTLEVLRSDCQGLNLPLLITSRVILGKLLDFSAPRLPRPP